MSWCLTIIDHDNPVQQGHLRAHVNINAWFLCGNCLKDFNNHFEYFTVDGYVIAECPDCHHKVRYSVEVSCYGCTYLEYNENKEFICHKLNRVVGRGGKKNKGGYTAVPQEDDCYKGK